MEGKYVCITKKQTKNKYFFLQHFVETMKTNKISNVFYLSRKFVNITAEAPLLLLFFFIESTHSQYVQKGGGGGNYVVIVSRTVLCQ